MVLASLSPGQYLGTDPCACEFLTSTRANTRAFKHPAKTCALEVPKSGSAALRNRSPAAATGAARFCFVRGHVIVRAAGMRACRSRSRRVLTGLRTSGADPPGIGRLARPATAASGLRPQVLSSRGQGLLFLVAVSSGRKHRRHVDRRRRRWHYDRRLGRRWRYDLRRLSQHDERHIDARANHGETQSGWGLDRRHHEHRCHERKHFLYL
jgi:hypothetical protein